MQRTVFFISDSTGITAETIGNSILAQFEGADFEKHRLSFINDVEKAQNAALRIKTHSVQSGTRPIVVNTMVDPSLGQIVAASGALMLDVLAPFIAPLEQELGVKCSGVVNRSHGLVDTAQYEARINATHYALSHDDGMDMNYASADLILVGVVAFWQDPHLPLYGFALRPPRCQLSAD